MSEIGVGVIGYGYWGPNLARNFFAHPGCHLRWICDLDRQRRDDAHRRYPSVRTTGDIEAVLEDTRVDAIVVATPVQTHHAIGRAALRAGKHVLVEKPLADQLVLAEDLVEEARHHDRILMVDHTFIYTGAVRKLKQLHEQGALGKLWYIDSVRINLGLFQHDVNVVWDLAPHDLAIVDHLIGREPVTVQATGACHTGNHNEDVAYLTLDYGNQLIAHLHVNWLSPVKVRQMIFGGSERMVIYNDLEPSEQVRVYDRGIDLRSNNREGIYKLLVDYRSGDMCAPALERDEALAVEANHFVECIHDGKKPITSGEAGLRVVSILEAAQMSIKSGGKKITL